MVVYLHKYSYIIIASYIYIYIYTPDMNGLIMGSCYIVIDSNSLKVKKSIREYNVSMGLFNVTNESKKRINLQMLE